MPTTPTPASATKDVKDQGLSANAMKAVMDVLNPEPLLDLTPATVKEQLADVKFNIEELET
jgi:hypothetical protein